MPLSTGSLAGGRNLLGQERKTIDRGEEESLLRSVGNAIQTPAMWALEMLNVPQQALYRTVAGEDAQALEGSKGYITGRQLLRNAGLVGEENTWGNAMAGLAVDVLADPINLIGAGALTKAGKVVSKAGTLNRAGEVLTNAARVGSRVAPEVAERVAVGAAKAKTPLDTLTAAEAAGRPLIRPRAASRYGTIRQLQDAAKNGVNVPGIDAINSRVAGMGDEILDMPFSRDIGIGVPGASFGFDLPGIGPAVRDAVDATVQGVKFGKFGTQARRFFDNTVGDAADSAAQTVVSGIKRVSDDAAEAATKETVEQTARLYADDAAAIFSEAGNKQLADMIERPKAAFNPLTGTVEAASSFAKQLDGPSQKVASSPAVAKYIKWWEEKAAEELKQSKRVGLQGEELVDPNVEGYLPRRISPLIQAYGEKNPTLGREISTKTPDMLARSESTKIPGGRNVLSFELASDQQLVGPKRLAGSDEAAADIIGKKLYGDTQTNRKELMELARLLHRLPPETLSSQPLFAQHPTEMIMQYTAGRARARAAAESQLDVLAAKATQNAGNEASASTKEVLGRLGLKSTDGYGAEKLLRDKIAQRTGASPEGIKLSEWFVPENLFNVLDTRRMPTSVDGGMIGELAAWWQSTWRNAILSWPSRYVRDLMGGMFSNHMEGALSVRGMSLATEIMKNGAYSEQAASAIARMEAYKSLAPQEAAVRYYGDLAATRLIENSKRLDRGLAGEAVSGGLPGAMATGRGPVSQMAGAYADTVKNIGSMFSQDGKFSQAGAAAGDVSDTFNRLSGYNELLFQGYEPTEAARRMKRTHVDYGSLSRTEVLLRNNFVPFYTFTSRMLGEQARRLFENPAQMNRVLEVLTAPQRYGTESTEVMPEYIEEKFGFKAPWAPQGENKTYFYNFDFPGLEQLGGIRAAANLDGGEIFEEYGGMINPLYKVLAENLSQTQIAPGRMPLSEKRGNLARALQMDQPSEAMQWLDRGVELLPGGARVGNLLRELTDTRTPAAIQIPNTLISNLTGFKQRTVSRKDMLQEAANQQLKRVKSMAPGRVRMRRDEYIPKAVSESLDPRTQRQYEVYKNLKRARNQRIQLESQGVSGLKNPG